ncbi:hypothetical protein Ssi03_23360 [Sphaerisporangium siamense]|uniref:Uncharacterized protein n=1 Tax=Sphaerisporangium siamense TaxID=795645 RepID=A0A7W7D824_9ACTN|nr:hypothetical protein [Sphaerisporangium siamense]MBB4701749.1 hypothetical protein [Sphaerisporangium siamense]GII84346.1 hypothetical protein Ssi03_23360 [Sphaerisporangium siamense]
MDDENTPVEQFSAEEYAFLRYVRFGTLPERVRPSEMVEVVATDRPQEVPDQALDAAHWGETGRSL